MTGRTISNSALALAFDSDNIDLGTSATVAAFTREADASQRSFWSSQRVGAQILSYAGSPKGHPLLYVVGKHDMHYKEGREYIFDKAPHNPLSRYVEVEAGHIDMPSVAVPEVVSWLRSLQN